MAYIGNQPVSAAFLTDQFSGNGSTVAFTMSVAPANTASIIVAISGVVQDPTTYSVSASTLTFSSAPPSGTGNISVRYLGLPANGVTTTAYRTVTEFTATAGQTVFAVPSYTIGYIDVYRNGVRLGTADYTASNGTSITLLNAATAGDLVVTESFYVSSVINAIPALAGQVGSSYLAAGGASQAFLDVGTGTGTGALKLPVGTTAQRPTGAQGLIRLNSTTGNPEWWDNTILQWLQFSQPVGYSITYLVAAGGGGGGGSIYSTTQGGGGGGGGLVSATTTLLSGTTYTITIGAGGTGGVANAAGAKGTDSVLVGIATALGGGGGATYSTAGPTSGGSGGGGSTGNFAAGAAGTAGQGYAGGTATGYASNAAASGAGGGGAGGVGGNGSGGTGGAGGAAYTFIITGGAYAGGGGGGGYSVGGTATGNAGAGGTTNNNGFAASANSAGGGGGSAAGTSGGQDRTGGNGGSGIVIIAYLGSQRGTGGTVSSSGGYTIHTFTSSGTYTA